MHTLSRLTIALTLLLATDVTRAQVPAPAGVSRILREQYPDAIVEVVDPYTFFGLAAYGE